MGLVLTNSSSEANKCAIEGLYSLFFVFYSLILSMFCMLFFIAVYAIWDLCAALAFGTRVSFE